MIDIPEGLEKAAELICDLGEVLMLVSTCRVVLIKILCTLQAERQ